MTAIRLSDIPRILRREIDDFAGGFHTEVVDRLYRSISRRAPRKTGTLQNSVFVRIGAWDTTVPEKRKYGPPPAGRAKTAMRGAKLKDRLRISINQNYAQVVNDRTGWIEAAMELADV